MMKRMFATAALAAAFMGLISGAEARQWKPTKEQQVQDYLQIRYQTSDNTIVFLQWIAPAMFPDTAETKVAREMTSKYVIVLLGHARVTKMGQWQYATPSNVLLETVDGKFRRPLSDDEMPPTVFGFVSTLSKVIAQGLGPLGRRIVTKVYSSEGISDCGKGGFWIRYGGERYDYQTPLPGCTGGNPAGVQSAR